MRRITFSRRARIIVLGMAVLLLTPLGAWASHGFMDVSTDNPYHADIDWVVENGISDGCEETDAGLMFCPGDPLTREHAARWFHRFADLELGVGVEGPAGEDGAQGPAGPAGPVGPPGPSDAFYYYTSPVEDDGGYGDGPEITIKLPDFGSYVLDTSLFIGGYGEAGSALEETGYYGPKWCQYAFDNDTELERDYYTPGVEGGLVPLVWVAKNDTGANASWSQVVTAKEGRTGLKLGLHCSYWLNVGQILITGIRVDNVNAFPVVAPSPSPSPCSAETKDVTC